MLLVPFVAVLISPLFAHVTYTQTGIKKSTTPNISAIHAGTIEKFIRECKLVNADKWVRFQSGCLAETRDGHIRTADFITKKSIIRITTPGAMEVSGSLRTLFRENGKYVRVIFPSDPDYGKHLEAFVTGKPVT